MGQARFLLCTGFLFSVFFSFVSDHMLGQIMVRTLDHATYVNSPKAVETVINTQKMLQELFSLLHVKYIFF